jgi:hypothetical protein
LCLEELTINGEEQCEIKVFGKFTDLILTIVTRFLTVTKEGIHETTGQWRLEPLSGRGALRAGGDLLGLVGRKVVRGVHLLRAHRRYDRRAFRPADRWAKELFRQSRTSHRRTMDVHG